jgi:hypothetical protein
VAGDLGDGRRPSGAATSDLELSARNVELGRAARVVDAELLDAEEVLSSGDLGGDGGGVGGWNGVSNGPGRYSSAQLTTHVPLGLATREGGANLLDLEPVGGSICGGSRGDLCHVEGNGALVVDGLVRSEGDGRAGSDRDSGSAAA